MAADDTAGTSPDPEDGAAAADLGTCVAGLVNAVARGMAQIVAGHGLTHIDFALLRLFLGMEEWTTTQLAEMLPLALSSISRSVTKLVDMGLVQRRRLPTDRRVVILTLDRGGAEADAAICTSASRHSIPVYARASANRTWRPSYR